MKRNVQNKQAMTKKGTNKKIKKAIVAPIVVAGLLTNTIAPTISSASTSLLVEVQKKEVFVVYKNESGKQKVLEKAIEVKDELSSLQAINVILNEFDIRALEKDPDIRYVERNLNQKVELLGTPGQWNVEAINAPVAWEQGFTGSGIKIAVIDSGVAEHSELPNVVQRVSFVQDDPDTAEDESSPYDFNGHGTHVAGIIGAKQGGPTLNGKDIVGVAPNVSIYSVKATHNKEGNISAVIQAIDWAIENNMDIINLSMGTDTHNQLLKDAVDRAYQAGILVVAAAGNDEGQPVNYPARYDSVIAVSAVDENKNIADFSNIGPEIEVSAPGTNIVSSYAKSDGSPTYANAGGTSQASPHVAGFLAILLQKNPGKSAEEIRLELQKYVDDLGEEGRDELYGYGFINYLAFDEEAPADVTDATVIDVTSTSALLQYTLPTDEDFAKVQIIVNGELVTETTEVSYQLEGLLPNTDYTVELKSVDNKGNVSEGTTIQFKTQALLEVTELQVAEKTPNSITVSFVNPTSEDYTKTNLYLNGELVGYTTSTTFTFEGLNPETTYEIVAKTVDTKGNESEGVSIEASTEKEVDVTAPNEVSNLTVLDKTVDSATISWVNPSDEDYKQANIYIDGVFVASVDKGENQYVLEGLTPDTSYTVVITTVDESGNESQGQSITFNTETSIEDEPEDVVAPDEVTGLQIVDVTTDSVTVTWNNPSNDDYKQANIYVDGQLVETVGKEQQEYVVEGLNPDTTYEIVVTTVDESGNESEGESIVFRTLPETPIEEEPEDDENDVEEDVVAPAEVSELAVSEITANSAKISWTNPSDEDYANANIYVDGELVASVGKEDEEYVLEGLTANTSYEVVVKTIDENGNESDGQSISFTTSSDDEDVEDPSDDEDVENPSDDEDTETPSDNEDVEDSSDDEDTETPSDDEDMEEPSEEEDVETPSNVPTPNENKPGNTPSGGAGGGGGGGALPPKVEDEKTVFEKVKDAVVKVLDTIANFLADQEGNGKEIKLEDFALAYEFNNQLTKEQKEKMEEYKNTIRLKEITSTQGFTALDKVSKNQDIKLTLKNAINPSSLTGEDVFVRYNGKTIEDLKMVVSEDGKTITFTTPSYFKPGKYSLFIDNKGLESIDGKKVSNPIVVVFNLQ